MLSKNNRHNRNARFLNALFRKKIRLLSTWRNQLCMGELHPQRSLSKMWSKDGRFGMLKIAMYVFEHSNFSTPGHLNLSALSNSSAFQHATTFQLFNFSSCYLKSYALCRRPLSAPRGFTWEARCLHSGSLGTVLAPQEHHGGLF